MTQASTSEKELEEGLQFCTFYLDDYYFGIEVSTVQEILLEQKMTSVPLSSHEIKGLINLRGQIVLALELRKRLGLPERKLENKIKNVIVNFNNEVTSLLVDEIGDVIEVYEKDFELPPETLKGVAKELITGTYKLEGKLLLILDTQKLLTSNESNQEELNTLN